MDYSYPRVQLNILPVLDGDCLHLRFQSFDGWRNVIIDSGSAGAAGIFRTLLEQISFHGEYVDLLCFSHIDDDHIKAAERVFSSRGFDSSRIRKIWCNIPDNIQNIQREVQNWILRQRKEECLYGRYYLCDYSSI